MPVHDDDAFVLTRYPFRERDWVVVLLTRSSGLLKVLARRVRGARHAAATGLEPLARVRISYFEKPTAELATVNGAELVRSAFALASDPPRWAVGQVIAEVAMSYCPPGQAAEPAFRLVDHCLERLLGGHDPATVWHFAELWFLRLGGIFPELDRCGACGEALGSGGRAFDVGERTFVCERHQPPRPVRLAAATVSWLRAALRQPLDQITTPCPRDGREWLIALRRHFTDRELRGEPYLRSLLDD